MYRVSFTVVYGSYVNESSFVDFLHVLETGFECLDVKNNMINYNMEVMCAKNSSCLYEILEIVSIGSSGVCNELQNIIKKYLQMLTIIFLFLCTQGCKLYNYCAYIYAIQSYVEFLKLVLR